MCRQGWTEFRPCATIDIDDSPPHREATVEYGLIDADNHYYEPEDCFTRYGDESVNRFVKWVSQGKRKYVMFGNVTQTMVANPTFNPITKPGIMHQRLKELAEGGDRHNVF